MIRIATLAAVAAMVAAAPASAQTIRVSTVGKTAEQVHADVTKAARSVCEGATVGTTFRREIMQTCMKVTISRALAQAQDPALHAAPTRVASR